MPGVSFTQAACRCAIGRLQLVRSAMAETSPSQLSTARLCGRPNTVRFSSEDCSRLGLKSPSGHQCAKVRRLHREINTASSLATYLLQPGGRWKSEYLVITFEQLIKVTGRIEVKRVRECALVLGPLTFRYERPETFRSMRIFERRLSVSIRRTRTSRASWLSLMTGTCLLTTKRIVLRFLPSRSSLPRGIAPSRIVSPLWASHCPFPARRVRIYTPRVGLLAPS